MPLQIDYQGGDGNDVALTVPFAEVTKRNVFYNNSAFDVTEDDQAVTTDKVALRPGDWGEAPMPEITFDQREGSTDRVTLIWDDYQIRNTWLEVTVLAAGLEMDENDVFYFGNAVGEACHSLENAEVNDVDVLLAQDNPHDFFDPAEVTCPYDYNRDGRVNATDMLISRSNPTDFSSALSLITVPEIEGVGHLAAVPEPGTLVMLAAAAVVVLVADRRRRNRK